MDDYVKVDKCGQTFYVPKDKVKIIDKIQSIDENQIVTIKEENSITKINLNRLKSLYDF